MKRFVLLLSCTATLHLAAQSPSYWRQGLSGLPQNPPASTSPADVARFERNLQLSAPYFARMQPNDYEANRTMVRRMAAYLAGLQLLARDPEMREAVGRAQRTFNTLSLVPLLGYTMGYANGMVPLPASGQPTPADQTAAAASSPPQPPPFAISAPALTGLTSADKATASDLCTRYEADAGRAAGAWQNAETLRVNLASRGMALNTATSTALVRLPSYLNNAAASLSRRDWDDARTNLARVESTIETIMKSVGR